MSVEPLLANPKVGAEMLGLGMTRFYQLMKSGTIENRYIGSSRRVVVASLRAYAAGLPKERTHHKRPEDRVAEARARARLAATENPSTMNEANAGSGCSPPFGGVS